MADDGINEFLAESTENLARLDREFVLLEQQSDNRELLDGIFRTFHTIKGAAAFFDFKKLVSITHVAEDALARMRDGKMAVRPAVVNALLAAVDAVKQILASIQVTGQEGGQDYAELVESFKAVTAESSAGAAAGPVMAASSGASMSCLSSAITDSESGLTAVADNTIRVEVALLDRLMSLSRELAAARNQVLQSAGKSKDAALITASQRLDLITAELQANVMKTRMQPIGAVWSRLPRLVRDCSQAMGKEVDLHMEGAASELDKAILEAIKDPFTHIVRNAIDHGIEAPEVRVKAGKPRRGSIQLRAFHEDGHMNIELTDDGAGIDLQAIRRTAVARGFASDEQAARMGERELLQLVFRPGFSTAKKVTAISGRGVGMDVVKTNIEKIGGTVEVANSPGLGMTVQIRIPVTLTILPADGKAEKRAGESGTSIFMLEHLQYTSESHTEATAAQ